MPDAAAAAAALEAGDIQALDNVSTTELAAVRQDSGLRVIQAPQLGWQGIFINIGNKNGVGNLPYTPVGTPLASSAKLRQAFEEAIDRNTLNKVVFGGLVQVSCTPIPPANTAWYDATKVPCTPYDPKDAKKLVAASGFPNPTVHLLTANTTDRLRLAQFIQAQEAAVGINVVIDSADSATVTARAVSGNFDTYFSGNIPGRPNPQPLLPVPRDRGGEELQRLLQPAARPDPLERAEGDEHPGTVDPLPRGAADHPKATGRSSTSTTRSRSQPSARTSPECS